jgi:hypothetical protein
LKRRSASFWLLICISPGVTALGPAAALLPVPQAPSPQAPAALSLGSAFVFLELLEGLTAVKPEEPPASEMRTESIKVVPAPKREKKPREADEGMSGVFPVANVPPVECPPPPPIVWELPIEHFEPRAAAPNPTETKAAEACAPAPPLPEFPKEAAANITLDIKELPAPPKDVPADEKAEPEHRVPEKPVSLEAPERLPPPDRAIVPRETIEKERPPERVSPRESPAPPQPEPPTQLAFGARLVPTQPGEQATAPEVAKPPHPEHEHPDHKERAADEPLPDSRAPDAPIARTVEPVACRTTERERAAAPTARTERIAPPESPKAPPVARDIKLELSGGDRKVEVRLVERAGEVHFAVRTPDDRLAGALREQLPLLSSRLEQSGFRVDSWHTAADPGPERRLDVAPMANSSGDGRETGQRQNGGQERREQPPPKQERADANQDKKEKGSRFGWLFNSLR